jgi:hypothetical protein
MPRLLMPPPLSLFPSPSLLGPRSHHAISKPGTVHLADYVDELQKVTFECRPVEEGATLSIGADGHPVRNDVILALTFPEGADKEFVEHLSARLLAEDAHLVFDHEFLASEAGFELDSSCAAHVPATAPWFSVVKAAALSPSSLEIELKPSTTQDVHISVDISFKWTPDGEKEAARRAAEGESLGVDVRRRRRELITKSDSLPSFSINYDKAKGTATTASIDVVAGGVLKCENCYAFFEGTYTVTFRFCVTYAYGYGT